MSTALLYPGKCILCGKIISDDKWICADCIADGLPIGGKICAFCGVGTEYCTCGQRRHHYVRRIACMYYEGGVSRGIARFKFYRHTALAKYYGYLLAENVRSKYKTVEFDAVIPVPMHWWDRFKRGYNCSYLLALQVSERLQIPMSENCLIRARRSKPQKRIKGPQNRAANVLDCFAVHHKDALKDKTVLLIDDVCTTGATLDECAKLLRIYGVKKVYAATFAAAIKGKLQKTLE
ncbi:MAG: ComF family protein [Clostridia bacterium]|nr:ComF family protein [Clostridia bacterium]